MEAKISLKGNDTNGYEVTVTLPVEWLRKFGSVKSVSVFNLPLNSDWGDFPGERGIKTRHIKWLTRSVADSLIEKTKGEIAEAKAFLASLVEIDKETIIDL